MPPEDHSPDPAFATTVIGAGSVGLALAASLAQAGQRVTLAARAGAVAALRASGITVSGLHGDHALPAGAISIEDAAAPSDAARACDMLVITTKAHDIVPALAPFTGSPFPRAVLSMHNGIGASEAIRAVIGPDIPVYAASMMIGLVRQGTSHVVVTAAASPIMTGPILGDGTAPIISFVAAAQAGFLPIRVDPAMRDTVLYKLLFNTCMNPTGALTGLTYGEMVAHPEMLALIERLADETLAVTHAAYGYRPSLTGADYLNDRLKKLVSPANRHRSSMLQDLDAGQRTEIDFLNGAVARLGREYGIPTPSHDALVFLIKAKEPGDISQEEKLR